MYKSTINMNKNKNAIATVLTSAQQNQGIRGQLLIIYFQVLSSPH